MKPPITFTASVIVKTDDPVLQDPYEPLEEDMQADRDEMTKRRNKFGRYSSAKQAGPYRVTETVESH